MTATDPMREALKVAIDLLVPFHEDGDQPAISAAIERGRAALAAQPPAPANQETALLLRRLQIAQDECMKDNLAAAAILLQDARIQIVRLSTQSPAPLRGRDEIARTIAADCPNYMRCDLSGPAERAYQLADAILALPALSQHERGAPSVEKTTDAFGNPKGPEWIGNKPHKVYAEEAQKRRSAPVADRAAIVEECAKVADRWGDCSGSDVAADIRALADSKGDAAVSRADGGGK